MTDLTFEMDPDSDGFSVEVFRTDTGDLVARVDLFAEVLHDLRSRRTRTYAFPATVTDQSACETWVRRTLDAPILTDPCSACDRPATTTGDDGQSYCREHVGMGG